MISSEDLKNIQKDLNNYDSSREKILSLSRSATRLSGWTILQLHRGERVDAKETLSKAKKELDELRNLVATNPGFGMNSNVLVALQEFAEANILMSFMDHGRIPSKKSTGVDSFAYILGLLDAVGEMRRITLDVLRKGDSRTAEKILQNMDDIFKDLISLDHSTVIPTFRPKLDSARRIIEATRGEVTTGMGQTALQNAISSLEGQFTKSSRRKA